MHSVARHVQLAARPHALRHHRRHMCAALNGFAELMQRGLGVHQRLSELEEPIATALIERGWCALDGVMDYEAAEHEPQVSPEERLRQALDRLPR